MLTEDAARSVVHVVGRDDRAATQAMTRTAQAIASQPLDQVLVVLAEQQRTRVRALQSDLAQVMRERTLYAVHLHGWEACLMGSLALRGSEPGGRIFCSPYRADFGPPWAAALTGRMLRRRLAPFDYAPVAASPTEARPVSRLFNRSAEVLPPCVADVFFQAARREDPRPAILAHGAGAALDAGTRLSVLLNGREPRVQFSWLGAPPRSRAQLEAAHVQAADPADDGEAARLMSRTWLFAELSERDDAPLPLAQAMAAGMPCLVSDTRTHRAFVHHGETGLICTSERDLVEKAVHLLRSPAERGRLGAAARGEAERRFTRQQFSRAVLRAYGFAPARPKASTPHLMAVGRAPALQE